jgi:hypothetical protein
MIKNSETKTESLKNNAQYVIVQSKRNAHFITYIPITLLDENKWKVLDYADYYTDACRKTDRWKEKITGTYIV